MMGLVVYLMFRLTLRYVVVDTGALRTIPLLIAANVMVEFKAILLTQANTGEAFKISETIITDTK